MSVNSQLQTVKALKAWLKFMKLPPVKKPKQEEE